MEQIVNKILNKMEEIEYGWVDKHGVIHKNNKRDFFLSNYRLQTNEETLQFKVGTCWEQTELIRYYCDIEAVPVNTYIVIYNDDTKIARHTIAVVNDMNKKYYWLENSWKRIGKNICFSSLEDILETIVDIFPKIYKINNFDKSKIEIYEYKKPRPGLSYYDFSEYCRKQEKIDLNKILLDRLNKFYIYATEHLYINEITQKEDFLLTQSNFIKDPDCNYAININSKADLETLKIEVTKEMKKIDAKPCIVITPTFEQYEKSDEIFKDGFKKISTEDWLIFEDFDKLEDKTNSEIKLVKSTDMKLLGEITYNAFNTGDEDDPYGEFDEGYKRLYENYNGIRNEYTKDFYLVKMNDDIVGTVVTVYDKKIYGIYALGILKEFRGKGIGKDVIIKLLKKCEKKNIKTAFLQTEEGFYPDKLYKKLGFKSVGNAFYYEIIDN